jgi:hypothetical protein
VSRRNSCFIAATVAICTFLPVGRTLATEPGDVEDLIRQGVELRKDGKDARALPFFQRAYALAPTPRTAAQLGLVEMVLGYRLEAERHLLEALGSMHDIWVNQNRQNLDSSLARVRSAIGELAITGTPAGAAVLVNGHRVGELPLARPLRLGEGPVRITVSAAGFVDATTSTSVAGSQTRDLHIDLVPDPARAAPLPPRVSAPAVAIASSAGAGTTVGNSVAAGRLDVSALAGMQVWMAGVSPAPSPSWAARLSGGYLPAALAAGSVGLRLGGALGFSFITEDVGRIDFVSVLATPGLRFALAPSVTGAADLGLGVLIISGINPGSVLLAPGAKRVTGALGAFEVRPCLGLSYDIGRSLFAAISLSLLWDSRADEQLREGPFTRFETGLGLGLRL